MADLQVALSNGLVISTGLLKLAGGGLTLHGRSLDGRHFVKIGLAKHPDKANSLLEEAAIIRDLNAKGCVTCPSLIGLGRVPRRDLSGVLPAAIPRQFEPPDERGYPALVLPWLDSTPRIAALDLLLSLAEQRRLGWFHADLQPRNTRYPPEEKICYLIDYDQAEPLAEEQRTQPLVDFLRWADARIRAKYHKFHIGGLFHFFPGFDLERNVLPLLREGRLDIGATDLFQAQQTTLHPSKIYHAFKQNDVLADGERSLDGRLRLLDQIEFAPDERVLDVGCNAGLLSGYLAGRGCLVTAIDIDPHIVRGARILANLRGESIHFACLDLDRTELLGDYDTILLFSVLHHTQHVVANAARLAQACRRIIIECRLRESGAKPAGDRWVQTSVWSHPDLEALVRGLCELFPGFSLHRNCGLADRERYILELCKIA